MASDKVNYSWKQLPLTDSPSLTLRVASAEACAAHCRHNHKNQVVPLEAADESAAKDIPVGSDHIQPSRRSWASAGRDSSVRGAEETSYCTGVTVRRRQRTTSAPRAAHIASRSPVREPAVCCLFSPAEWSAATATEHQHHRSLTSPVRLRAHLVLTALRAADSRPRSRRLAVTAVS